MEKSFTPTTKKVSTIHIPDDVEFSILSKISLKSLKRFECVSKSWSMLLKNPYFMKMYQNRIIHRNHSDHDDDDTASLVLRQMVPLPDDYTKAETFLYFVSNERFENKVIFNASLPTKELGKNLIIVGSVSINGILCVTSEDVKERKVVLWNPATDELKVVPPSPVESVTRYRYCKPQIHGFGYDYVRDDYKLIRYVRFKTKDLVYEDYTIPADTVPTDPVWEIYSLSSNSWRTLNMEMPMLKVPATDVEIVRFYLDGMCHWWTQGESHRECCYNAYLVSFDVINEVFFKTPMPSDLHNEFLDYVVQCQLVTLNGYIALIQYYGQSTSFYISLLGELGVEESWTELFYVRLSDSCNVNRPIGVGRKGNIYFMKYDYDSELDSELESSYLYSELVCFDLDTQRIDELGVKAFLCQMAIYKKSLLSI
ncbi:F-box/kelch-repeat protein At3g06240-like [Trifolium pratense]|nr:F-box/kelch-repeat protein At3g06240-like [Trifolium pratense]